MKKIKIIGFILMLFFVQNKVSAQQQLENSMSQHFRNRMLLNPGFTGVDGNKVYAFQNRSWIGFDGAPVMNSISGEINFGQNSAAGIQVMSDVSGILNRTLGAFNYSYKIKFNEEQNIRIGISFSFEGNRLNNKNLEQSAASDPLVTSSMNSTVNFDGNIGIVYTIKKFAASISFNGLGAIISGKNFGNANLSYANIGLAYDNSIEGIEKLNFKPLLMLRLYKTTSAVLDLGAQFEYNKLVNAMMVYQSTGNIRAGAGLRLNDLGEANFFYNTKTLYTDVASQQYELGIGFYFLRKK